MPVIGTRIDVEGQRTPGGRPLPVTGEVLASTTVIERSAGGREYPDVCRPAQEELAADEMRLICLGSGNPYLRRAQAAMSSVATAPTPTAQRGPMCSPMAPTIGPPIGRIPRNATARSARTRARISGRACN